MPIGNLVQMTSTLPDCCKGNYDGKRAIHSRPPPPHYDKYCVIFFPPDREITNKRVLPALCGLMAVGQSITSPSCSQVCRNKQPGPPITTQSQQERMELGASLSRCPIPAATPRHNRSPLSQGFMGWDATRASNTRRALKWVIL